VPFSLRPHENIDNKLYNVKMERRPSNRHPGGAFSCWACRFRPNGAWPRRPPVPTPWAGGRAPPVASSTRHHAAVRCGNTPTVPVLDHRVVVQTTGAGLRGLASTSLIQPWRGRAHRPPWPALALGPSLCLSTAPACATSFSTPPESRSLAGSRSRCHCLIHTTSKRRPSRGTQRPARSSARRLPPRSSRRPFAGRHAFCCVEVRVCCIPDPA
jgi:hypothetical protein